MKRTVVSILAVLFAVSLSKGASAAVYAPEVGQPHVDFVLPRIDSRQPVALSQYRGQKVLLIQFASW